MDIGKVIRDFYREFEALNLEGLAPLLAPHAMVHSPVFGKKDALAMYRDAFSRTKRIKVVIKEIFLNPENPRRAAASVNFTWEIKEHETMVFEGIVIFELNHQGKIQLIEVIYDAQSARDAVKKQH